MQQSDAPHPRRQRREPGVVKSSAAQAPGKTLAVPATDGKMPPTTPGFTVTPLRQRSPPTTPTSTTLGARPPAERDRMRPALREEVATLRQQLPSRESVSAGSATRGLGGFSFTNTSRELPKHARRILKCKSNFMVISYGDCTCSHRRRHSTPRLGLGLEFDEHVGPRPAVRRFAPLRRSALGVPGIISPSCDCSGSTGNQRRRQRPPLLFISSFRRCSSPVPSFNGTVSPCW